MAKSLDYKLRARKASEIRSLAQKEGKKRPVSLYWSCQMLNLVLAIIL
jgi:hypothetical protein